MMTETEPISAREMAVTPSYFSCEHCLRMFVEDGSQSGFAALMPAGQRVFVALIPAGRRVFVVPEIFQCGLPECAAIVEQNRRLDEAREKESRQRLANWRQRHQPQRNAGPNKCRPMGPRTPAVATGNQPYADKDLPEKSVQGPDQRDAGPGLAPPSEAELQAQLDPGATNKLFAFLTSPERLGKWFSNREIEAAIGNCRLNSVVSRLRARLRDEGGKFVLPDAEHREGEPAETYYYRVDRGHH